MKKLDHVDMFAHIGLGLIWAAITIIFGVVVCLDFSDQLVQLGTIIGALVVIYREVIQDSTWCEFEYSDLDEAKLEPVGCDKKYRAGRGLKIWKWGRQKLYETLVPAGFLSVLGFLIQAHA